MQLNYESVGSYAKAQAEGTPEEIAALVLAIQERHGTALTIDPEALLRAICDKDQEAQ